MAKLGSLQTRRKTLTQRNQGVVLQKPEHYGIRRLPNHCFPSYLNNRKQFVTIIVYNSNLANVICGVPDSSIFVFLLLSIDIGDPYLAKNFEY